MARKFRRGFKMVNGQKRKHIWAKDGTLQTVGAMSVSHRDSLQVFEGLLGSELLGATIQLSHLDIMIVSSEAIPEIIGATAFAARLFTQSTLANLTVGEGPISDPNADWSTYVPMFVTASDNFQGYKQLTFSFKSQRRLDELGQSMLVSFENQSSSDVSVRYGITWGVLLP